MELLFFKKLSKLKCRYFSKFNSRFIDSAFFDYKKRGGSNQRIHLYIILSITL